ncbi:PadR family transcriptional regulator [Streptomyces sp. NEAU-YJ-81]|uniref:PadR family transcriptional regulator n=1 Tax=Streptomyces sp. NEAU-YJ-81 TaxID=2820288 RepID=UPI001ABC0ABF|nr:PadR family transcriptional regulator [Streptomyces sp. NEAU-YJ-81]MBO3677432.1 helix-turn-helix transcriptional regulator [Streptomyces sp. NEAU-YJ-81]
MPPVFAHGRLRLYLLKLLDEAPRHGYEVIRLLEERFQGLYAPSAGTVYPRLAKLEAEGLVTHTTEGGRKVYSITDAGRAELADRSGELADLELEIRESVAELAAEIRDDVRGSASDLRREMREAAQQARSSGGTSGTGGAQDKHGPWEGPWGDKETWRQAKEDMRRAKEEWKEQARRAKEESRRARQDAQRARKQAKDAQDFAREEVQRIARRVQEQTQEHIRAGDWQQAVREGLAEVSRGMSRISRQGTSRSDWGWGWDDDTSGPETKVERMDMTKPEGGGKEEKPTGGGSGDGGSGDGGSGAAGVQEPEWARDFTPSDAPARDLERLLDRLRDDIRDAARDHGVTDAQLADARHHLGATAARITALLRGDQA